MGGGKASNFKKSGVQRCMPSLGEPCKVWVLRDWIGEAFSRLAMCLLVNLLQGLQLTGEDFNLLGLCGDGPFLLLKTFL